MRSMYKLASHMGAMRSSRLGTRPPPRTANKTCSAMVRRMVTRAVEKLLVLRTQQLDPSGRGNLM